MGRVDYSSGIRPGIYNAEYFSGAQVAVYIGDIWVDEITSLSFAVQQNRVPLYGYSDILFRQMSVGGRIVTGQFTLNFKEAGYLFLVLDRYAKLIRGRASKMDLGNIGKAQGTTKGGPFNRNFASRNNIEQVINGELTTFQRNGILQDLAFLNGTLAPEESAIVNSSLTGFASTTRASATTSGFGEAENAFETFENAIWRTDSDQLDETLDRSADDPDLNPFDIYIAYGDFDNDARNHTMQKLVDVHITGSNREIAIDGQPIQEAYSFIAKNLV